MLPADLPRAPDLSVHSPTGSFISARLDKCRARCDIGLIEWRPVDDRITTSPGCSLLRRPHRL